MKHIHHSSGPLGISGASGSHHLPRPHQSQQEMEMMGKPYSQYGVEPLIAGGPGELKGSSGVGVYIKISLSILIYCLPLK